ncbi:MAG: DUF4145 domain-containing protein [Lachnospiraceae bacterium]|nr:DUF4145 domain-containing protein [Lachnospiraceae bacterium]
MGTNLNSSWEKIQQGVSDVERLICQKEYNASMIKARQTLEFMVNLLAERAGFTETADLKTQIDTLYQNRLISKNTCERYHKIRIIGNKAAHEGDANAYNANQAYHTLSQEVYAFADLRTAPQKGSRPAATTTRRTASPSTVTQRSSATRSRRRQAHRAPGFTVYDLLKLLIPILCIVLVFCIVRLVRPGKGGSQPTAEPTTSMSESTPTETTAAPETETEATQVYKTSTVLNVRPEPNTTSERIGQLDAGTTVEYVGTYDDTWAIIRYNDQEAYVASQYLTTE